MDELTTGAVTNTDATPAAGATAAKPDATTTPAHQGSEEVDFGKLSDASPRELLDAMSDDEETATDKPVVDKPAENKSKADEPTKATDDQGDADAPDLSAYEGYEFVKRVDPELLKDKSVVDYLKQTEDGVRRVVDMAKKERDALSTWAGWADALSDETTAQAAYDQLGQKLGLTKGSQTGMSAPQVDSNFDWTKRFDTKEDYEVFKETAEALYGPRFAELDQLKSELANIKKTTDEAQVEKTAAQNERAFTGWLNQKMPTIKERIARDHPGFEVDREMVDKAIRHLPEIAKADPVRAILMYHHDALIKHYSGAAKVEAKKGPETPDLAGKSSTIAITPDMSPRAILDALP